MSRLATLKPYIEHEVKYISNIDEFNMFDSDEQNYYAKLQEDNLFNCQTNIPVPEEPLDIYYIQDKDNSDDIQLDESSDDYGISGLLKSLYDDGSVEVLGNDVLTVVETINKYKAQSFINVEDIINLEKDIVGTYEFNKNKLPNIYSGSMYNYFLPYNEEYVRTEAGIQLANLVNYCLFGFDIIRQINIITKNITSATFNYSSLYRTLKEDTDVLNLINFVVRTCKYRGIMAYAVPSKDGRPINLFISNKKLSKEDISREFKSSKKLNIGITKEVFDDHILRKEGFIYLLNKVDRYKVASVRVTEYYDNIRKRKNTLKTTPTNCKAFYNLSVKLIQGFSCTLDSSISCESLSVSNAELKASFLRLPGSLQNEYKSAVAFLGNLFKLTRSFTWFGDDEHKLDIDLSEGIRLMNYVYDDIIRNFEFDRRASMCTVITNNELENVLMSVLGASVVERNISTENSSELKDNIVTEEQQPNQVEDNLYSNYNPTENLDGFAYTTNKDREDKNKNKDSYNMTKAAKKGINHVKKKKLGRKGLRFLGKHSFRGLKHFGRSLKKDFVKTLTITGIIGISLYIIFTVYL